MAQMLVRIDAEADRLLKAIADYERLEAEDKLKNIDGAQEYEDAHWELTRLIKKQWDWSYEPEGKK